jgi:hypothetical protein
MFDVYVEGPSGHAPDAAARLIDAMAQRYNLPIPELASRLAKGRFRVKGNLDHTTAMTYVRDLEAIGARVTIAEAKPTGGNPISIAPTNAKVVTRSASSLPPQPRLHPETIDKTEDARIAAARPVRRGSRPPSNKPTTTPPPPRPSESSLPPPVQGRTTTASALPPGPGGRAAPAPSLPPMSAGRASPSPSLPPMQARTTVAPPIASGLSAAFATTGDIPIDPELGALDGELALASLDGIDDAAPPPITAAASSRFTPASVAPARPVPVKSSNAPLDLFAPPAGAGEDFAVELADDEVKKFPAASREPSPPPRHTLPPPLATSTPPTTPLLQRKSQPSIPPAPAMGVAVQDASRARFLAGIGLAFLLGLLPAHIVASVREGSYAEIDEHVAQVQAESTRPGAAIPYAALDEFRDAQHAKKVGKQRSIAGVSLALWALFSGGAAFVWFRVLPRR